MSDIAIRVENLSKLYRIGERERYKTLRDTLTDVLYAPFRVVASAFNKRQSTLSGQQLDSYIWALKDISFEVKKGEVVGIIGRNGAGKSTLLKILSRITEPTEGYAEIRGRVGSLLEVGTGFHPELTGRENIYLNGAILGMKKAEIDQKFDEIVAFAEIEKFIDTPVKRYSSGMYVRLAFAVAAHMEPEILLVDEVLSVGDAAFQKKCLGKMGEVSERGRTVLFVSHNMAAIRNLCPKSILLEAGRISIIERTDSAIEAYLCNDQSREMTDLALRQDRKGTGIVRFTAVSFHRWENKPADTILSGDDFGIKLQYNIRRQLPSTASMVVAISLNTIYGECLFLCSNELTNEIGEGWPASGVVTCRIRRLPLSSGLYRINIYTAINGEVADWVLDADTFEVQNSDFFGTGRIPPSTHGCFLVPHSWSVDRSDRLSPV